MRLLKLDIFDLNKIILRSCSVNIAGIDQDANRTSHVACCIAADHGRSNLCHLLLRRSSYSLISRFI